MSQIKQKLYTPVDPLSSTQIEQVALFLRKHLGEYGDPIEEITASLEYAMGLEGRPGGFVVLYKVQDKIIGTLVMNKTGMHGYIPDNVLVYIAIHEKYRGKGIGKQLTQHAIKYSKGDIALHVEPENPAFFLYKKLGFDDKYLEMRYLRSN